MKKTVTWMGVALVLPALATDGIWYRPDWNGSANWSDAANWDHGRIARDGGVATMPSQFGEVKQNVADLVLSGLYFPTLNKSYKLTGNPISLTGEAVVSVAGSSYSPDLQVALQAADATATFTKTGDGTLRPWGPLNGFASLTVDGGALVATNVSGTVFGDAPLAVRSGMAQWAPAGTGDATASVPSVVAAGRMGTVRITRGGNATATLTAGSATASDGATLVIRTTDAASLGTTENVKVAGAEPAPLMPAQISGQSAAAPYALYPVANSAESGFVRAQATASLVSGTDVPGVASVATATTITSETRVAGVEVSNRAPLTIAEGTTLSVGTGLAPAGVWFTDEGSGTANDALNGPGTLAFGDQEGFIYRGAPTSGTTLTVGARITGSQGVSFVARTQGATGTRPQVTFAADYQAAWTGPTHFAGVLATLTPKTIPLASPIHVDGAMGDIRGSGAVKMNVGTYTNEFHLAGGGDGGGALYVTGVSWQKADWQLAPGGALVVDGDAKIGGVDSSLILYRGPVSGSGDLALAGKVHRFEGANTLSGKLTVGDNVSVQAKGAGSFGTGDVVAGSGSRLYYTDAAHVQKGAVAGTSSIFVQNGSVTFEQDVSASRLTLSRTGSAAFAGALTVGELSADAGTTLTGTGSGAVLTLGRDDGSTTRVSADLAGTMAVVKTGADTVEFHGPKSYSGQTSIRQGTLRLSDAFPSAADLAFWLDASDASSYTISDGRVTEWRSKAGTVSKFTPPSQSFKNGVKAKGPEVVAEGPNGLPWFFFQRTEAARLFGSGAGHIREVFCVAQAGPDAANTAGGGGFFGVAWTDVGVRSGASFFGGNTGGSYYQSLSEYWFNGERKTSAAYFNTAPTVLTFGHDIDAVTGFYNTFDTFTPALGGHQIESDTFGRNWDGWIGEVLAFSRVLSEDERKWVENYLAGKWLGRTLHADVSVQPGTALPTTTDLTVNGGATFDLGGVNATVASLAGAGEIVNSSTNPATLTVSGACTFSGRVSGPVTLKLDTATDTGIAFRDGATLAAAGPGTYKVGEWEGGVSTNGLVFWVDAQDTASLCISNSAEGVQFVSNWNCRAATPVKRFYNARNTESAWGRTGQMPRYVANAVNGKPAVYFTTDDFGKYPGRSILFQGWSPSVTVRTLVLVGKCGTSSSGYMLGANSKSEIGFIMDAPNVLRTTGVSFTQQGESLLVNGRDESDNWGTPSLAGDMFVILGTCGDWNKYASRRTDTVWYLGCYGNAGADFYMCEAMAFDRVLSMDELRSLNAYLVRKWGAGGENYPVPALDGASLVAEKGASLDLDGAAVTVPTLGGNNGTLANFASLTVTDSIWLEVVNGIVDPLRLTGDVTFGTAANGNAIPVVVNGATTLDAAHARQEAVVVSGDATGSLTLAEDIPEWRLTRMGTTWALGRTGMMIIFR